MLLQLRIEKVNEKYVVAKISDIRLKQEDILYRGFDDKDEALNFLKAEYEVESYHNVTYDKYYKEEYRDICYTMVTCVRGIELTTEELLEKLKNIVGYIPYTLKHFRGRRKGDFFQYEHLWMNSVRSGTYYIDDFGNVNVS